MSVIWALLGSAGFGVGDLGAAIAARRNAALVVALASQAIGLAAVLLLAPFVAATWPTGGQLIWAVLAGLVGATAYVLFLWSLANGPVGVVAPITAVLSVVVPIGFGLADGERPALLEWTGVGIGVAAILLLSTGQRRFEVGRARVAARVVAGAIATGLGFGVFYVVFSKTGSGPGLWPLVIARGASVSARSVVALVGSTIRLRVALRDPAVWVTGLLDVTANACALFALRSGELSISPVILSLYPAFTVGLATVLLHERVGRAQLIGLLGAAVAIAFVAAG